MVIIKRNLKGILADQVEREFNEYVKQNSRCNAASGNPEEIKQNLRCPKDSYEQGTFKCDPSMSKAVKNEEAKQTAKQGLDKNKDLTLREKSLKQATGMMSDLSGKYEALKKELQDKKKGMSNPDSPRNKKQLREIEKKMKSVGDNMDRVQKAIDKNSREFNTEKKKPGDGAMKRIAKELSVKSEYTKEEKESVTKSIDGSISKLEKEVSDAEKYLKKHGSNKDVEDQLSKNKAKISALKEVNKGNKRSTSEKTFEKVSERYPDRKASTTVVASGNSFKITGKGFNGETSDNLVEGLTSRKEAENVAEMIVENTPPGVMAADLNKPVFAVTKGRETTEDGDPIVSVKFWRQDGLLNNFAVVQRNGEWDFPVTDKVTGVDIEKNIDMIKSAIDKAEDGKESPMWVGKRLPESRFKK